MAGFDDLKYAADSGNIYYCRVESNDAVAEVYGDEPAGAITEQMTIFSSKGRRGFGIHARGNTFSRVVGTDNAGGNTLAYVTDASLYRFIPIGTKETYDDTAHYAKGDTVVIKGITWASVSRVSEQVN